MLLGINGVTRSYLFATPTPSHLPPTTPYLYRKLTLRTAVLPVALFSKHSAGGLFDEPKPRKAGSGSLFDEDEDDSAGSLFGTRSGKKESRPPSWNPGGNYEGLKWEDGSVLLRFPFCLSTDPYRLWVSSVIHHFLRSGVRVYAWLMPACPRMFAALCLRARACACARARARARACVRVRLRVRA